MVFRPVLQFAVSGLLALVLVGIGAFFVLRSQGTPSRSGKRGG